MNTQTPVQSDTPIFDQLVAEFTNRGQTIADVMKPFEIAPVWSKVDSAIQIPPRPTYAPDVATEMSVFDKPTGAMYIGIDPKTIVAWPDYTAKAATADKDRAEQEAEKAPEAPIAVLDKRAPREFRGAFTPAVQTPSEAPVAPVEPVTQEVPAISVVPLSKAPISQTPEDFHDGVVDLALDKINLTKEKVEELAQNEQVGNQPITEEDAKWFDARFGSDHMGDPKPDDSPYTSGSFSHENYVGENTVEIALPLTVSSDGTTREERLGLGKQAS